MSSTTTDPAMHTAEHLLNQTMIRTLGCDRCFSAHINKKKSKCDYHFERDLTEDEIRRIETSMNEIIMKDLTVDYRMISWEDAAAHFNTARIPEARKGEDLRIVAIGGYDACPCIGEHVESTRKIGTFHIVSASFEQGILRIRFKLTSPR